MNKIFCGMEWKFDDPQITQNSNEVCISISIVHHRSVDVEIYRNHALFHKMCL